MSIENVNQEQKKEVLSFFFVQAKEIKQGIAKNCLNGAMEKSCLYAIADLWLWEDQVESRGVGFFSWLYCEVCVAVESYWKKKLWQAWTDKKEN